MTDPAPSDVSSTDSAQRVDPLADVGPGLGDDAADVEVTAEAGDPAAASEAFQTLANEVRVAVLCELLAAERRGDLPRSFTDLQEAAEVYSSAGFAYHLRQLSGQFVAEREDGYELTPAGRAAARAIAAGAFTDGLDPGQAS